MKIFISHSLPRSRELAKTMEWFLRQLFPSTAPWISTAIEKGADSVHEIGQSLQDAAVGVLCLTQENLDERWILFEAGALAKQLGAKVCTLLLDVKAEDVKPPLNKFQHTTADHDEVLALVESINKVAKEAGKGRREDDLKESFELLWPKLEETIKKLKAQGPPAAKAAPKRTAEDMMAEVLATVRGLEKRIVLVQESPYRLRGRTLVDALSANTKRQQEMTVARIIDELRQGGDTELAADVSEILGLAEKTDAVIRVKPTEKDS